MTAQALETFLTDAFLNRAADTLATDGFISDEHDFAPYRETLSTHRRAIQDALQDRGFDVTLHSGYIHHRATYAYFIFDTDRFAGTTEADAAVSRWLDRKYAAEH